MSRAAILALIILSIHAICDDGLSLSLSAEQLKQASKSDGHGNNIHRRSEPTGEVYKAYTRIEDLKAGDRLVISTKPEAGLTPISLKLFKDVVSNGELKTARENMTHETEVARLLDPLNKGGIAPRIYRCGTTASGESFIATEVPSTTLENYASSKYHELQLADRLGIYHKLAVLLAKAENKRIAMPAPDCHNIEAVSNGESFRFISVHNAEIHVDYPKHQSVTTKELSVEAKLSYLDASPFALNTFAMGYAMVRVETNLDTMALIDEIDSDDRLATLIKLEESVRSPLNARFNQSDRNAFKGKNWELFKYVTNQMRELLRNTVFLDSGVVYSAAELGERILLLKNIVDEVKEIETRKGHFDVDLAVSLIEKAADADYKEIQKLNKSFPGLSDLKSRQQAQAAKGTQSIAGLRILV